METLRNCLRAMLRPFSLLSMLRISSISFRLMYGIVLITIISVGLLRLVLILGLKQWKVFLIMLIRNWHLTLMRECLKMNRNVESHFASLPRAEINRSVLDRSHNHKFSGNVGDLIPFFCDPVLPGDTFRISTSSVIRLQTLLTPVYDELICDIQYYFVPSRICWNHWKEFWGENNTGPWIPTSVYQVPTISSPSGGFSVGTIADYLGLPVGVDWTNSSSRRPSALPFRAYALICNDFWRDQNVSDPLNIPLGDSNQTGSNGGNYINDVANGGLPFKVARFHDVFSSSMPSPQKGPTVTFPLISGDQAPIKAGAEHSVSSSSPIHFRAVNGSAWPSGSHLIMASDVSGETYGAGHAFSTAQTGSSFSVYPSNLYADLSTSVGAVSINELRLAFQLQKYYEKLARSGSRYTEWLRANFAVVSPDATLQRPEFLGGKRFPVMVHEVANTAQTATDFLGDVGAFSVTAHYEDDVLHSFTEHGYVIGVMCLRYPANYPQGMDRMWNQLNPEDFYIPLYANLGEMPVYKSEIYADNTTMSDQSVWGYQEAWYWYRYKANRCSGEMRPGVSGSLASWHYADYYTTAPTLSDSWMRVDKANVDRTLAVTSANANQFFADFEIKNLCTRPMPVYSVPGLIDHH